MITEKKYPSTTSLKIILALSLGHFVVDSFTGIWPLYKTLIGLDLVKAGLIASISSTVGNALQIFFGHLSDRGFRRVFLKIGILLSGTTTVLPLIPKDNYFLMGLAVFFTFIGSSLFHPTATGVVSQIPTTKKGKSLSLFLLGGYVGFGLSQMFFLRFFNLTHGKTWLLLILPLIALVFISSLKFSRQSSSYSHSDKDKPDSISLGVKKKLIHLYLLTVLAGAFNISFIFLLPELMKFKGYPHWLVFGGGHMLFVLGSASSLVLIGHLVDRFGSKKVMIIGFVLTLTFAYLVVFPVYSQDIFVAILIFFLGSVASIYGLAGITYGHQLLPDRGSTVSALLMGTSWSLANFSTIITGFLAKQSRGGNPVIALGYIAFATLVALVLSLFLSEVKNKIKDK